jgi:hypothetical protein
MPVNKIVRKLCVGCDWISWWILYLGAANKIRPFRYKLKILCSIGIGRKVQETRHSTQQEPNPSHRHGTVQHVQSYITLRPRKDVWLTPSISCYVSLSSVLLYIRLQSSSHPVHRTVGALFFRLLWISVVIKQQRSKIVLLSTCSRNSYTGEKFSTSGRTTFFRRNSRFPEFPTSSDNTAVRDHLLYQ